MKQETGDNSTAYQAKRDINLYGLSYQDVKNICFDLMAENFPKLKEEAMTKARENVLTLAEELKKEIDKKADKVDPSKLAQPDVQATLNEAVQGGARKGTKIDLNLLAKLLTNRLANDNTDFLDVTIEEAIRLIPKLSKKQINFLSIHQFIQHMRVSVPNIPIQLINQFAMPVQINLLQESKISINEIEYLSGIGLINFNPIISRDPYEFQYQDYKHTAKDLEEFKIKVKESAPSLDMLLEHYIKNNYAHSSLNTFAKVIALTNLNRFYGELDLKIWIN